MFCEVIDYIKNEIIFPPVYLKVTTKLEAIQIKQGRNLSGLCKTRLCVSSAMINPLDMLQYKHFVTDKLN